MRTLTINTNKPATVGKTYIIKFAGRKYRGVCTFFGDREILERKPGGNYVRLMVKQASFTNCEPVE